MLPTNGWNRFQTGTIANCSLNEKVSHHIIGYVDDSKRAVDGSDYPYVAAPALVSAKESLQQRLPALGLTPQAILSDNARRLFGDDIPVREYGERIVRLAEIALFSMQDKADPCKIYILEVYADREAYQAHLQTAHFRKYKEGTADMVKSLKLIDTNPLVTAEFLKKAQ